MSNIVADAILADFVHNGTLEPGDRLPTVRELERRYGASRATIVHALSILEQQGWIEKRQGSGCYLKRLEPSATKLSRNLIGFIARNTNTEVILRVYAGIERVARVHNMHVLVASSDDSYDFEREQIARLIRAGCSAIVLFPVTRTERQLREDYLKKEFMDFPIVLVDIAYPEQKRPQVVFDNYLLGYEMTEMLLHEGHRRIAFMDLETGEGLFMHYSTRERYRGYLDALHHAGVPVYPEDRWTICGRMPGADMFEEVMPFLHEWKRQESRPTAVIAIEDFCAMRTIEAAQVLGIHVPEDLTVVGFDNLAVARSFSPPFPTSDPDFRRAGEIAGRLVLQQLCGTLTEPVIYMLPVPIKRRRVVHPDQREFAVSTIHNTLYPT
jgi:GntR family transcriptional regulator of arabinose operon